MQKDDKKTKQLIWAAQGGDERAFEALIAQVQTPVYRLALSLLSSHEDAEDASQETLVKLWRTLPDYRGECPLLAWVLRITRNTVLDMKRRARPTRENTVSLTVENEDGEHVALDVPDTDEYSDPARAYARAERIAEVRRAIELLSPEHKEILVLKDMQGYSYEQIGQMLELNEGTVKSRLARARKNLADLLCERNIF